MMNFFEYGGKRSCDFGIYISGSGTFNFPERDCEMIEVPGRSGDLIIDNGRFKNIMVTYPAYVRTKFKEYTDVARMWLMQNTSYQRLEDSYNPEMYRMARFAGPMDFDMRALNHSGEFEMVFDCKPQRFLKSGEYAISATTTLTLYNPTLFEALPLIRVYGTDGSLYVGNNVIQITSIDGYVDIDSDTQNAYKGSTNCNGNIVLEDFPVLGAGQTTITVEGNITSFEVIPRWWTA